MWHQGNTFISFHSGHLAFLVSSKKVEGQSCIYDVLADLGHHCYIWHFSIFFKVTYILSCHVCTWNKNKKWPKYGNMYFACASSFNMKKCSCLALILEHSTRAENR